MNPIPMNTFIQNIVTFGRKNGENLRISWPLLVLLIVTIAYNIFAPHSTLSERSAYVLGPATPWDQSEPIARLPIIQPFPDRVLRSYKSQITVYNSVPWQTDGDPFTTASGSRVHDGTVAANCLPFGTRLRMPDQFGDKVFVVEDRLASHKSCFVIDIWQDHTLNPPSFGAPITTIEILDGSPKQSFAFL